MNGTPTEADASEGVRLNSKCVRTLPLEFLHVDRQLLRVRGELVDACNEFSALLRQANEFRREPGATIDRHGR